MTKFKHLSISLLLVIVFSCKENTDEIVMRIANINQVQYQHVGIAGIPSPNYKNYEKLRDAANTQTLLNLVRHENAAVSCYAGWALIDKKYKRLPDIFTEYLKNDRGVSTISGCLISRDSLSNEFYHHYWNKVEDKENDATLKTLDSLIIYQEKPDWLLLLRALENRLYDNAYNPQIAVLAFEKHCREALLYLSKWHSMDFESQLKEGFVDYLNKTDFSDVGTSSYYDIAAELLKLNDAEVRDIVIKKLKKDTHWRYSEEKFEVLFNQYGISSADLEK